MEKDEEMLLQEAASYFEGRKYANAYTIYSQLADKGNITALVRCGYMYEYGIGTKKNLSAAYRYLEKATQLGNEEAKERFAGLCGKAPFNVDGTISLIRKKRSVWATVAIVLSLLTSFMNIFTSFTPSEDETAKAFMLSMGIGGGLMFVCTLLLLLWKKPGGYILIGFIAVSSIFYPLALVMPSGTVAYLMGFSSFGLIAAVLFLLLQIKKQGVPAWNVLMQRPYVGRNVLTEMKDNVTAYGRGEQFHTDSPETRKFALWGKVATILVAIGAIACGIAIIIAGRFDFHINWNFFSSALAFPLFIVGLLVSLLWLDALTYKYQYRWKDSVTGKRYKADSNDVIDVMEGQVLMPLLTKFVIYPIIVAAGIYYILMSIFYILEAIFPYITAVLLIGSIFLFYSYVHKTLDKLYRKALIPAITLLFVFIYFLVYMVWNSNIKGDEQVVQEEVNKEAATLGDNGQKGTASSQFIDFGMRHTFEGTLDNGKSVILTLDGSGGGDFNLSATFCYKDNRDNIVDLMGNASIEGVSIASENGLTIKGIYDGKTFKGTLDEGGNAQAIDMKQTKAESLLD